MPDRILRDYPEPQSFSQGVDRLVELVRPPARAETAFPLGLNVTDMRRSGAEDLHGWFVRLANTYCQGEPQLLGIEENIALLAKLKWEKERLIYANIPTLVTQSSLEDYYLNGGEATYCRLDLDYQALGEPFSHPLAHIHVGDDDAPRFALDGGTCGNVVMDFLEFIYRNHVPGKWLRWARRQWLSKNSDEQGEEQFNQIVQAFRDPQFSVLRANAHIISQVKRRLREAKDSVFSTHMDGADREILEYPAAR